MIGHPDSVFHDAVERHHEALAAARRGGPDAAATPLAQALRRLRDSRCGDVRPAHGARAHPARP